MEQTTKTLIDEFLKDPTQTKLNFPPTLSKTDRLNVHKFAEKNGLYSMSTGEGEGRYLLLMKTPPLEKTPYSTFKDVSTRKSFCKDFQLPISIYESPYFEYYIDLYKEQFKIEHKIGLLSPLLSAESSLHRYSMNLQEKIVSHLKGHPSYRLLTSPDLEKKYAVTPPQGKWLSGAIYVPENEGKYQICVDIKTANFTCLRLLDPSMVLNCNTWGEFVSKFSPYEYFQYSKHIRQVIFGNVNSKRIAVLIKHLNNEILNTVLASSRKFNVTYVHNDEIVIDSTEGDIFDDYVALNEVLKSQWGDKVKIEPYRLVCISKERGFWVKEVFKKLSEGKEKGLGEVEVAFKCIGIPFFAMAFKRYHKREVVEYDRKFLFEGHIATFDRSVC